MVCLMPYDGVAPRVTSGGTVCKTTFGYVVQLEVYKKTAWNFTEIAVGVVVVQSTYNVALQSLCGQWGALQQDKVT